MQLGWCCKCGCEKINFKVYDFATGDLLWQKLLNYPKLATDGDIYADKHSDVFAGYLAEASTAATTTITGLPSLSYDWSSAADCVEISIDQFDAETGDLVGNSGWFRTGLSSSNVGYGTLLTPSHRQVNASGDMIHRQNTLSPVLQIVVRGDDAASDMLTYYLDVFPVTSATMTLTLTGIGGDINGTFAVDASAATVQSTLASAWSSHVSSVTVTGTSLDVSGLKIVVEYSNTDAYVGTYNLAWPGPGFTPTAIGQLYFRNLETGLVGTPCGFSSIDLACFSSETDIVVTNASPVFPFTAWQVSYVDTTADPWTKTWYDEPFVGGSVPYDPKISSSNLKPQELAANDETIAIVFPATAGKGVANSLMATNAWDNTGTILGRDIVAVVPPGASPPLSGSLPEGLCLQDDGSDVAVNFRTWYYNWHYVNYAKAAPTSSRYVTHKMAVTRMPSSLDSYTGRVNLGSGFNLATPGFNSLSIAFITDPLVSNPADESTISVGDPAVLGTFLSGILNDDLVEVRYWQIWWEIFQDNDLIPTGDAEWRFKWSKYASSTTLYSPWFALDITLTELNAELLTLFGTDADGNLNCEAETGIYSNGVTADNTTAGTFPLYLQGLKINARGAKTVPDQEAMETPPIFVFGNGLNAENAYAQINPLVVQVRSFENARPKQFGSLAWSDGDIDWNRNWSTSPSKLASTAVVHADQMYVLGVPVCAEDFAGLTLEDEETTTPPYAVSSDTASFDLTFRNLTGVALTSLTLTKAHDGNGSLNSPTMPSTLAVGESATVTLTYSTSTDSADVTLTVHVTGTKPDATTVDSNELSLLVDIDPLLTEPPEDPP